MPRRPSKKQGGRAAKKAKPVDKKDSNISKWNKASDIPLDDQDQFHASRDKILLEGGEYEHNDDGDEEEVFGLEGMSDGASDEDVEMEYAEEAEEVEEAAPKKKEKKKSKKKAVESSSEEEEESEQEEKWGRSKAAYYSSNAAQLESDDEEGNELEEAEAKRLQTVARQSMGEHDFGLDDAVEVAVADDEPLAEPTPVPVLALPTDKKLLLRHLEKTNPEALALARDWDDTAWSLMNTQKKIAKIEAENPDALSLGMSHLHYQALLTYATTLAFYLHLRASEKYAQRPELLQAHPILPRLLTLKQSLSTLEDLDFNASEGEDDDEDSEESEEGLEGDSDEDEDGSDLNSDDIMQDANQLWSLDRKKGLDSGELAGLLSDAIITAPSAPPKKKRKTVPASKPKSKPKPVFDLIEPIFPASSKASSSSRGSDIMDAYGEASSLQHADAADKSARVKSLRFHTSKIESASARRQGARLNAVGGDDDLPYREKKKDFRGPITDRNLGQGGADLDDVEPDAPANGKRRRDSDDEGGSEAEEGADGYYELVKRKSKEKKEQKQADYDAYVAAEKPVYAGDDASGPRSLTRAIMANKGLTPHRPKSVRNPRVKKRLKFEKAKKKISSQKAIYSGGIGDVDKYTGEKSGISKVVKSVRLG